MEAVEGFEEPKSRAGEEASEEGEESQPNWQQGGGRRRGEFQTPPPFPLVKREEGELLFLETRSVLFPPLSRNYIQKL